jgi:hypothetical protein
METWDENPVVAPHDRSNKTAFIWPSGDTASRTTVFVQSGGESPQPASTPDVAAMAAARISRIIMAG